MYIFIKTTIKKLFYRRDFRFLIVGGINTVVGYSAFVFFVFFGFQYLIANTLSMIVGVINSYLWNRFFTFKSKNKALNEIVRFSFVYLLSYCVSMLLLYLLVGCLGVSAYFAGFLNIITITLISWFGHRDFSFKERK